MPLLKKQINVLYIDDEPVYITAFRASFRRQFNIFTALSAEEAKQVLSKEQIHIVIADNRMPGTTGMEFFKYLFENYPRLVRILITAYKDTEDVIDAVNIAHVFKYMLKPWEEAEMEKLIKEGYEIFLKEDEKEKMIKSLEFFARQNLLS